MTARPGPRNLLTDVPGLLVGQAEDPAVRTGVTVVLAETPAVAACDVRGGAPGTRETDLLAPDMLVEAVDAIVLSGGSVYGLGAADGVTAALGARRRGFTFRSTDVTAPIVPGAILFDLNNGGDKGWSDTPPYSQLGRAALAAAASEFRLGTAGAGAGAMAGALKGGTGSASLTGEEGITVGALACVNSFGSVLMPRSRCFWAWPFEADAEFGGVRPGPDWRPGDPDDWGPSKLAALGRENTTIAVVGTDAALTPAQTRRLAVMAQDGLARAIRPVHAPSDGDAVFVLATGRRPLADPAPLSLAILGERAATCLARAIARGVYDATAWPGSSVPSWRDLDAHGRP
jgi:L-aminopeptidase/D-esterase-like protein